jgi:subtilisin-like proprotein convertase family protein
MSQGWRGALVMALVGTLVIAFAGIAAGKVKTKTFSSGNLAVDIPGGNPGDETSHVQTFNLNKKKFKRAKVKDVDVRLRLSSAHAEDLAISLSAPRATTIQLVPDTPGDHFNEFGTGDESCSGSPTVFNDEAETLATSISGSDPLVGQFRPTERLSALDGSKVKGKWRLSIVDNDSGAQTLHCAELKIKYKKKRK